MTSNALMCGDALSSFLTLVYKMARRSQNEPSCPTFSVCWILSQAFDSSCQCQTPTD
jgi:hypothetical protein